MAIFFSQEISDKWITLRDEEHRHAFKSMRKKTGDQIEITDGQGNLFECLVHEITKKHLSAKIIRTQSSERTFELSIGVAVTKNLSRLEWFVEKGAEMGVKKIVPIKYKYGEKPSIRKERLEKIALSAMKQSRQYFVPEIADIQSIEEFLPTVVEENSFYAEIGDQVPLFSNTLQERDIPASCLVLIGPEGHFSSEEISLFETYKLQAVSLGKTILRVETAATVAAAIYTGMMK